MCDMIFIVLPKKYALYSFLLLERGKSLEGRVLNYFISFYITKSMHI